MLVVHRSAMHHTWCHRTAVGDRQLYVSPLLAAFRPNQPQSAPKAQISLFGSCTRIHQLSSVRAQLCKVPSASGKALLVVFMSRQAKTSVRINFLPIPPPAQPAHE